MSVRACPAGAGEGEADDAGRRDRLRGTAGDARPGATTADDERSPISDPRDVRSSGEPADVEGCGTRRNLAACDAPRLLVPHDRDSCRRQRFGERCEVERVDAAASAVPEPEHRSGVSRRGDDEPARTELGGDVDVHAWPQRELTPNTLPRAPVPCDPPTMQIFTCPPGVVAAWSRVGRGDAAG